MNSIRSAFYEGYHISVVEEAARFTPRVTREGALINLDGAWSDGWAGRSYGSFERAMNVAKAAIDTRQIQ